MTNPEFQNPSYKSPKFERFINKRKPKFAGVISEEISDEDEKQKQRKRCLEIQDQKQDLENKKQENQLRTDYADWAKKVARIWLIFVAGIIIVYCTIKFFYDVEIIPQWVFVTVLASTTVTIFSLNSVIAKGLFIKSNKRKGRDP